MTALGVSRLYYLLAVAISGFLIAAVVTASYMNNLPLAVVLTFGAIATIGVFCIWTALYIDTLMRQRATLVERFSGE